MLKTWVILLLANSTADWFRTFLKPFSTEEKVEKGFKNVRNQSAVELARSKITQVLSNSTLPPPNLSPEEKKALQELRSDHTIRIMRARQRQLYSDYGQKGL